jgi:hypothetical protein
MRLFTSEFFPMIPRPKICQNCGIEASKLLTSEKIAIAELRRNISLKSCGLAIEEVLPSSCGIAIADSKKSCACPTSGYMLTKKSAVVRAFSREKHARFVGLGPEPFYKINIFKKHTGHPTVGWE